MVLAFSAMQMMAACAHDPKPPPPSVELRLVAINDFHGNLDVPSRGLTVEGIRVPAGGIGYLAAHVDAIRALSKNVLVVSAGDLIGASPLLSALFHDEPTVEAMNLLGLDINGVGNHEFDEGRLELLRMKQGGCHPQDGCTSGRPPFAGADFDFLAANVIERGSGETLFPSFKVASVEGVKVAFIGLTLEGTKEILPPVVPELEFLDEAETANGLVKKLREEGIRAFVLLLHEGGFPEGDDVNACTGLSGPIVSITRRLDPDIDVVISGHTHRAYICSQEGLLLTSGGSFGRLITDVRLTLDRYSGDVVGASAENVIVGHSLPAISQVEALVSEYRAASAPLANRVVAQLAGPLTLERNDAGVCSLGRAVADAQLMATKRAGAQLAITNSGGLRADIDPALGPDGLGKVTYAMAFSAQPFGNLLVTMTLTGRQILELLQAQFQEERPRFWDTSSNLSYVWRRRSGSRSKVIPRSVRLSGRRLRLNRRYRVTVNSFLAGRPEFASGRRRTISRGSDLAALVGYLGKDKVFRVPELGGVRVARARASR